MVRSTFRAWAKVALPVAFISLVALTGLVARTDSANAYGNGDGTSNTGTIIGTPIPLAQSFFNTFEGDYVSAGVGMRDSGPPGGGTIALPAIPGGASVQQAFLYWAYIDEPPANGSNPNITINGNAIAGSYIGTTGDPCWTASGAIDVFVADVTAYALPGANNAITGLPSSGSPAVVPLLDGASIVLIYDDPGAPLRTVIIHEGAVTFTMPPTETTTFTGFDAAAGSSRTTWVVADGQPGLRNQTWVDGNMTADFVLDGSSTPGTPYWDDLTQDVSADVPANDTDLTVGASSENFGAADCITWVAQVLSVPAKAVVEGEGGGPPVVGGITGLLEGDPQAPRTAAASDGSSSWLILAVTLGAGAAGFVLLSSGAAVLAYSRRRISR